MKRFLAVLMLSLILMIPVATAQSVVVTQFAGQDGANNVAKSTDTLTVKVLVSIPGDTDIEPSQVQLVTSEGIPYSFNSCIPQSGQFQCTLSYALEGEGGEDIYSITLTNDAGTQVAFAEEILVNDFVSPELFELSVNPTVLGQESTVITYRAEDYSFSPGETSACAGVGSIKIYEGGITTPPKAVIQGTTDVNNCTMQGTFSYRPAGTGDVRICGVAFDRIGRTSAPLCTNVTVDRSAPAFRGFGIFTQDGVTVHSLPPAGIIADIEVYVEDNSLQVNTVSGDFGVFSGNAEFDSRSPNEVGNPPLHTLRWNNVPITKVTPCEFRVRATDNLGNSDNHLFHCDIVADTSAPEVLGASTGYTSSDGTMLLGIQGRLMVRFKEAGMARANAYLDTDGLGLGTKKAYHCAKEGTEFVCYWELPANVPSARYQATVLTTTMDDLGNALQAPSTFSFDYDSTIPVINSGPRVEVFHASLDYGDKLVRGDTIELTYNVSGAVSAIGDFSKVGGSNVTLGYCDESEECRFSQEIVRSGPYKASVPLRFVDEAGNKAETKYEAEVFTFLNDTDPNYWTSVVTCSPSVVDRAAAKLINHQVYCRVKLSAQDASAQPVITSLGAPEECTGELLTSTADLQIINNGFLSKEPYLRLTLATQEYLNSSLNMTCPVYILTKITDGFTQFPERENVTLTVQFGDSDIGTMAANIDDKVQDAVDDAERLNKWIGSAAKFMQFGEKVCTIRTLIWDIIAAYELIHGVLTALEKGPQGAFVAGVRAAACGGKSGLTATFSEIDTVLAPFCGFINCKGFAGLGDFITDFNFGGITGGQPTAGGRGDAPGLVNVKESLVWSAATLCVPGLIHNIDKYRQIQCRYATCLKRDVQQNGIPMSVCDDEKAYLTCTFVWGQLFNAIPFAALIDSAIKLVQEFIANPFAAIAAIVSVICPSLCESGDANMACSVVKVIEIVGRVVEDVDTLSKNKDFFKLGNGPCEELESLEDEEGSE